MANNDRANFCNANDQAGGKAVKSTHVTDLQTDPMTKNVVVMP